MYAYTTKGWRKGKEEEAECIAGLIYSFLRACERKGCGRKGRKIRWGK